MGQNSEVLESHVVQDSGRMEGLECGASQEADKPDVLGEQWTWSCCSIYGLAGKEEGMGLQKEVGPGYESQAVSVLCSSDCGNSWRGILRREIDPLTDNSWPQSSLLLSLPLSRYIQMPSSTPSPL